MSQVPVKLSTIEATLIAAGMACLLFAISLDFAFPQVVTSFYQSVDLITALALALSALLRFRRDRAHYLPEERYFDLFISIPFSLAIPSFSLAHGIVLLLHCVKLYKLRTLFNYFKARKENLDLRRHQLISLIFFGIFLAIHMFACGWIVISPPVDLPPSSTYIRAVYFIITTMATVGYGDIAPTTDGTRIFAVSVMIIGVGSFSLLIAQMSRLLLEADKRKAASRQKLEVLESFLNHYEIPVDVQRSVYGYYTHLLNHKMNDLELELMNELPQGLQTELQIYMNLKPLAKVSLFRGCQRPCLIEASTLLEHKFYAPGEAIIEKGQRGHEMFVLGHGSARIIKESVVVGLLKDGDCFGELSLIYEGTRQATIIANTYCDIFKLTGESFRILLGKYPELQDNMNRIIAERKKAQAKYGKHAS